MTTIAPSERGFSKAPVIFSLSIAAIVVSLFIYFSPLPQMVRESLMQRVTSAHYEILCPRGALPQEAMTEVATQRETLFTSLNKKLGNADSNLKIRIIFDPKFPRPPAGESGQQAYSVTGTTIRTKLNGQTPQLPAEADAEGLLYAAWGKPGNAQFGQWTEIWLVGEWNGAEIGMAAAEVEQRLGHKRIANLLTDPGGGIFSPKDRALLGAAWISEIAEFGGGDAVRKLYAAKMLHPNVAEVAKALGTTPLELDRRWQLWMYAYLAGISLIPHESGMPMKMPMAGNH